MVKQWVIFWLLAECGREGTYRSTNNRRAAAFPNPATAYMTAHKRCKPGTYRTVFREFNMLGNFLFPGYSVSLCLFQAIHLVSVSVSSLAGLCFFHCLGMSESLLCCFTVYLVLEREDIIELVTFKKSVSFRDFLLYWVSLHNEGLKTKQTNLADQTCTPLRYSQPHLHITCEQSSIQKWEEMVSGTKTITSLTLKTVILCLLDSLFTF